LSPTSTGPPTASSRRDCGSLDWGSPMKVGKGPDRNASGPGTDRTPCTLSSGRKARRGPSPPRTTKGPSALNSASRRPADGAPSGLGGMLILVRCSRNGQPVLYIWPGGDLIRTEGDGRAPQSSRAARREEKPKQLIRTCFDFWSGLVQRTIRSHILPDAGLRTQGQWPV
jgi:hypothetical protein